MSPKAQTSTQKLVEVHQFKDIKTVDDLQTAKNALSGTGCGGDNQRILFQRNYDATNQSYRTPIDLKDSMKKNDEKIVNELDMPRDQAVVAEDYENHRMVSDSLDKVGNTAQARVISGIGLKDHSSSISNQGNQATSVGILGRDIHISTDINQPFGYQIEDNVNDDIIKVNGCSSDNDDINDKLKDSDRLEVSLPEDDVEAAGGQNTENVDCRVPEVMNVEIMEVMAQVTYPNLSIRISDTIILCATEGPDKENSVPIVLHEGIGKASRQQADPELADEASTQMDIDKEAFFEEDLLENNSKCIMDDEKVEKESARAIFELDKIVISSSSQILESKMQEGKQPVEVSSANKPENRQSNQSSGKKSSIFDRLSQSFSKPSQPQSGSKIRPENLPPIKIKEQNRKAIQIASLSQRSISNKKTNFPNPISSLTKRPPIVASAFVKKPNTTTPAKKYEPVSAVKRLSEFKAAKITSNLIPRRSIPPPAREKSTPKPAKSSEKISRRPSVPKFFPSASKSPLPKLAESKLCAPIAARQEEAEQVLLHRKPPVPKFSESFKRKNTQNGDTSKSNSSRKPPVPKISELIKKKPSLN